MDFLTSLIGIVSLMCQLAFRISGEEGEFYVLNFVVLTHAEAEEYRKAFSSAGCL